jgi:Uma2 family endonuclease
MAAALPLQAHRSDPPRRRFSRSDVERMQAAGLFTGLRYELIQGDLIDKMSQNPPHAFCITRLNTLLGQIFGASRLRPQIPLEVAPGDQQWSLPEPDLAVLAANDVPPETLYQTRHPRGDETALVVEVADTTLRHDLTAKRDLYARAGVPEYWVLDITGRRLILHRDPIDGEYAVTLTLSEQESAGGLLVSDLLPRA